MAADALLGKSYSEAERALGEPDRVLTSDPPYWEWKLSTTSDPFGPLDTATLRVHFNRAGLTDEAERTP